jgi:hypothetical protein
VETDCSENNYGVTLTDFVADRTAAEHSWQMIPWGSVNKIGHPGAYSFLTYDKLTICNPTYKIQLVEGV